jgi:hypothetical protein
MFFSYRALITNAVVAVAMLLSVVWRVERFLRHYQLPALVTIKTTLMATALVACYIVAENPTMFWYDELELVARVPVYFGVAMAWLTLFELPDAIWKRSANWLSYENNF